MTHPIQFHYSLITAQAELMGGNAERFGHEAELMGGDAERFGHEAELMRGDAE